MALQPLTDADFNTVANDPTFVEQGAVVSENAENKRIAKPGTSENSENKRIAAKKSEVPPVE